MVDLSLLLSMVSDHSSKAAAARALGIPVSTLRGILNRAKIIRPDPSQPSIPARGFEVKRNGATYNGEGNLTSQTITTSAAPGEVYETPAGHTIKGESVLLDPDGRVLTRWVKTKEGALGGGLVEALQGAFERFTGTAPIGVAPTQVESAIHTIYPLVDLHLGMYAWGKETGDDYDVEIAVARARAAYRSLVTLSPPSRTATLLNLGDYFHANDAKFVTPGSGHQLDVDGRHPRVMEAGADLMLEIIDLLLQRHEQVEVVCLPGNHDPDGTVALRVALRLFYRKHDRVTVNNGPGVFWYKRFGKNLLGATHGHTIKAANIPGLMACDRPQDWGLTEFRSFFMGHIHHEKALERGGVRVESFQTLASKDAYATNGGWRSGQSVQAITFHHDEGEVSRSRVNVLAQSVQPC